MTIKPTSTNFHQNSYYSEVGKAAQIMPSWIRAVCRSRLDYDEDELLNHMKDRNIDILEASKFKTIYNFIDFHISILSVGTPGEIRQFVRSRQKQHANMYNFCRYETDGKKKGCWSCPRVREIIEHLGGYDGKKGILGRGD
jgi:hypothetical protein